MRFFKETTLKLIMSISPLLPEYFVDPDRAGEIMGRPILYPSQIPIHPLVYDSALRLDSDFIDEVRAGVPDMLRRDISTIERMLSTNLGLQVTDTGIIDDNDQREMPFTKIHHYIQPGINQFSLDLGSVSIGLLPSTPRQFEIYPEGAPHPLPQEVARQYAFLIEENTMCLHTWFTHNMNHQGPGVFHYLRAFAMEFNNKGLRRLGL